MDSEICACPRCSLPAVFHGMCDQCNAHGCKPMENPPDTSWVQLVCACGCGSWPHRKRSFWEWLRWMMSSD